MRKVIVGTIMMLLMFAGISQADASLIQNAKKGNLAAVQQDLLEEDVEVNGAERYGYTALIWAADGGYTDIVNLLLGHGASVDLATVRDYTALIFAASKGHVEVVKTLLLHGADVNRVTLDKYTAFSLARLNGHTQVQKVLQDHIRNLDRNADESKKAS